jgi:ribosome-binding factor A
MASKTNLRLAEIIRQRAAQVILFELKDPRMGFVTITRVKLSADLATATIYWSVLGRDSQKSKTLHALEHARLFVQRRVAEGLRTRVAPELVFEYDESVEGTIRMGSLLKQLRHERGDDAPGEAPPADASAAEDAADAEDRDDQEDAEDADEEEREDAPDDESADADPPEDDRAGGAKGPAGS